MQDNDIKEELSKNFLKVLAAYKGIKASSKDKDHGVDINLTSVSCYLDSEGKASYIDDGKYVDVQLKSTTISQIKDNGNVIEYSLRGKNYNDLLKRKNGGISPLILILFVLPNEKEKWVNVDLEKLLMFGSAYWFKPIIQENTIYKKDSKVKIKILKDNQISEKFFDDIFTNKLIWK